MLKGSSFPTWWRLLAILNLPWRDVTCRSTRKPGVLYQLVDCTNRWTVPTVRLIYYLFSFQLEGEVELRRVFKVRWIINVTYSSHCCAECFNKVLIKSIEDVKPRPLMSPSAHLACARSNNGGKRRGVRKLVALLAVLLILRFILISTLTLAGFVLSGLGVGD